MTTELPTWTLTGPNGTEDTLTVTVRPLTGARARNTVPDILEVLTSFASTQEGTRLIATLMELANRSSGEVSSLVEELPMVINQFAVVAKPILDYFEKKAIIVLTTATPADLETYGTFPEFCLMVYGATVYHYKTSMSPQVNEALKKFSNALVAPATESVEMEVATTA